jgi:hypothetical protein
MVASSAALEALWPQPLFLQPFLVCNPVPLQQMPVHRSAGFYPLALHVNQRVCKLLRDLECDIICFLMFADNQGAPEVMKHPIASCCTEIVYVMQHLVRERDASSEIANCIITVQQRW